MSNARGTSRALQGTMSAQKSPSRVWDGDDGVAGRNWREQYIPLVEMFYDFLEILVQDPG